jgi:hypothetical protein
VAAIERTVGGEQRAFAVGASSQAGECAGLHRVETGAERGVVRSTPEDAATRLGEAESVSWLVEVLGEVAEAGVDVRRQLDVVHRARLVRRDRWYVEELNTAGSATG